MQPATVLVVAVVLIVIAVLIGRWQRSSPQSSQSQPDAVDEKKRCVVMGNPIDPPTPYSAIYKGKTIYFCCSTCVDMFNKDPEKYMNTPR